MREFCSVAAQRTNRASCPESKRSVDLRPNHPDRRATEDFVSKRKVVEKRERNLPCGPAADTKEPEAAGAWPVFSRELRPAPEKLSKFAR